MTKTRYYKILMKKHFKINKIYNPEPNLNPSTSQQLKFKNTIQINQ